MRRFWFVLALFVALPVAAEDGMYVGVNFVKVDYKESGFPTVSPTAIAFRLGKELTPNFAVEGRFGTGLSDDAVTVSGVRVAVEVESFYGAYARGILPLGAVSLYGLLGYTKGEITARAGAVSVSADDSDITLGLGADINLSKNSAINLEIAQLLEGTGYEANSMSVGYKHSF